MERNRIIAALTEERDSIDAALVALGARKGPLNAQGRPEHRRRHMSAAARQRISDMMKKRWAERKRKMKAA